MKLVKKCGIGAVITAALFLTAALVIGCMGPYDGPSFQEAYKPPAGKGAVRLNFNSSSGRTILPVAMALTDFYDFELDFEADPMGSGDDDTVDITRASLTGGKSAHFPLEPGDYRLVVTAFLGTGSRGNPAAVWTSGDPGDYDVTITAG
ncbi:MAG: hypothetical protein LBH07_02875, partial [Treponema sp.]|nr:hypothetical protein [Treponema sp.]